MRQSILAVCRASLCVALVAAQPRIDGLWLGTLHIGVKELRVAVRLADDRGSLTGTSRSLDQDGNERAIPAVTFENGLLRLTMSAAATFEGRLSRDGAA